MFNGNHIETLRVVLNKSCEQHPPENNSHTATYIPSYNLHKQDMQVIAGKVKPNT